MADQGTGKVIELPHDKRVARAQNVVEDWLNSCCRCRFSIDLFTAGGQ